MDLKKGNKRDVWVVFHKESSQTTSIHSFKETLQQESIKFTLETLGHSA